ncbi:MAG: RNA methyltransferase [Trichlorobacter sp.]|jgi:hypothetical protein
MSSNLSIALLHHPVYNKHREIITTAFTNLDIHDIARTARTFGVESYFMVTPSTEQRALIERIVTHWDSGWGSQYNPDRKDALRIIKTAVSLEAAVTELSQSCGLPVSIIVTGAMARPGSCSFTELRKRLNDPTRHYLLVLGTGHGLADSVFDAADLILEPIAGSGDYNHLPVRSALAIMLDRLNRSE